MHVRVGLKYSHTPAGWVSSVMYVVTKSSRETLVSVLNIPTIPPSSAVLTFHTGPNPESLVSLSEPLISNIDESVRVT